MWVTGSRIRHPDNLSEYEVEFQGLVREAYDPALGDISCIVARFNDPLDSTIDNLEFYRPPLRPYQLKVRAIKDINPGDYGYLPYGASFWCIA